MGRRVRCLTGSPHCLNLLIRVRENLKRVNSLASQSRSSLTVDVEEYYHATNLDELLGPASWHKLPSRVEESTRLVLDIFDEFQAKGTFFTLGSVALRHPDLIKEIVRRGHELASHGYGHRLVYTQTPKSFYRDVRKAKLLLEDISGREVKGYRAPNFSIIDGVRWAYDKLVEAGYTYDSSLYPVRHPRYGNFHRSIHSERISAAGGELLIIPLTVFAYRSKLRVGIAGGGWWRLLPETPIRHCLRSVSKARPLNCYLHPWELDANQPHYEELSRVSKFRHYTGLKEFPDRIRRYLKEFGSAPLENIHLK
jgi:polysaccharide deacetylase family protein (PEP-CTERM system associated)